MRLAGALSFSLSWSPIYFSTKFTTPLFPILATHTYNGVVQIVLDLCVMATPGTNWSVSVRFRVVAFIAFCCLLAGQIFFRSVGELQVDYDKLGAVASESKLCTQVGIDLLKAGGNAADAVGLLQGNFKEHKLTKPRQLVPHFVWESSACIIVALEGVV